jgi:ribosome biogenesis GTPase / thiamine phosphate phosphatase
MTANKGRRALVSAGYGRLFELWEEGNPTLSSQAVTRGKKTEVCVGDWVVFESTSSSQSVIESVETRTNEVKRSDAFRTKWLAANVDLAVLVIAADPPFSDELATRVRCAADVAQVPLLVLLNKSDLIETMTQQAKARLKQQCDDFTSSNAHVIRISAKHQDNLVHELKPHLQGKTSLMLGQSGMGKSTVLNRLVPSAQARTQEVSRVLNSGKHTTTHSKMFCIDKEYAGFDARLIDSPGFQTFGLGHLSMSQLQHAMPEFSRYLGNCRFSNCKHYEEPQCAIRQAVDDGIIGPARYAAYKTIARDIEFIDRANLRS